MLTCLIASLQLVYPSARASGLLFQTINPQMTAAAVAAVITEAASAVSLFKVLHPRLFLFLLLFLSNMKKGKLRLTETSEVHFEMKNQHNQTSDLPQCPHVSCELRVGRSAGVFVFIF